MYFILTKEKWVVYAKTKQTTAGGLTQTGKTPKTGVTAKKIQRPFLLRAGVILFIAVIAVAGGLLYKSIRADRSASNRWHVEASGDDIASKRPPIDVALLEPNEYSRPQTPLEKVNGIVIHYTANPMTGGYG